jgi:hypothetical protein
MKRILIVILAVAGLLAIPSAALAQSDEAEGVLVRVNGNATVSADEVISTVVVVKGDLALEGVAKTVVVVDGTVDVIGATIDTLVVVRGSAVLADGATVTGDVWLTDSTLTRSDDSTVEGSIRRGLRGTWIAGLWIVGLVLGLGLALLTVLGALTIAAIAPNVARRAGAAIRGDLGHVALAGLFFWIVLPLLAGLLIITLVGIPAAFAVWFAVMPIFAFLGYIVVGIWLGELMVARQGGEGHPYLAAFVGTTVLVLVGIVPGLGWIAGMLASLLGGSALALLAWRAFRSNGDASAVDLAET